MRDHFFGFSRYFFWKVPVHILLPPNNRTSKLAVQLNSAFEIWTSKSKLQNFGFPTSWSWCFEWWTTRLPKDRSFISNLSFVFSKLWSLHNGLTWTRMRLHNCAVFMVEVLGLEVLMPKSSQQQLFVRHRLWLTVPVLPMRIFQDSHLKRCWRFFSDEPWKHPQVLPGRVCLVDPSASRLLEQKGISF